MSKHPFKCPLKRHSRGRTITLGRDGKRNKGKRKEWKVRNTVYNGDRASAVHVVKG